MSVEVAQDKGPVADCSLDLVTGGGFSYRWIDVTYFPLFCVFVSLHYKYAYVESCSVSTL